MPHTRFHSPLIVICSGHSLEWDVVGIHKHVGCDGVIVVVLVRVRFVMHMLCTHNHDRDVCGRSHVGVWWVGTGGSDVEIARMTHHCQWPLNVRF